MLAGQSSAVILAALEASALTAEEELCFKSLPPAGFTLFRRNLSPQFKDIKKLCYSLQALVPPGQPRMMVAIDQEGGRVARLKSPFPDGGPALELAGGRDDTEGQLVIENHAFTVGACLRELGIQINFAPVLDILSRDDNPSIGDRCFGRDAESVAIRAGAFMRGLIASDCVPCLKHFPGQGHGAADTHEGGTRIDLSKEELLARELVPFMRLMQDAPLLMISHAIYPALDPQLPASLSSRIIQDLLREQLQYKGIVVTDDMNMKAIGQDKASWSEAIVQSVAAGADLVLVCRELERYRWAAEALAREAQKSSRFAARMEQALQRLHALRSKL